jgi:hypothetical protein
MHVFSHPFVAGIAEAPVGIEGQRLEFSARNFCWLAIFCFFLFLVKVVN